MAGEFDLSARITADASGLVQAADQGEAAYDRLDKAQRDAAGGAKALEDASERATKAQDDQARSQRGLGTATEETTRETRENTAQTLAQVLARERASKAAIDTAAAEARLSNAQSAAERSAASAALAALRLQQAQERQTGTTTSLDRELAALRAQLDPVGEAERRLARDIDLANTALDRGIITQEQYARRLADLNNGSRVSAAEANRHAFAVRNLGQQFGDLGTQVALGQGFFRAFVSQAGQMGYAASEMGGKIGAVGRFLVGPWGIALTTATVLLAPFIEKLIESGDEAKESADKFAQAATAADSFGNAQSILGKVVDLTTGKLKTQNETLIRSIALQGQALKVQGIANEAAARRELSQSVNVGGFLTTSNPLLKAGAAVAGIESTSTYGARGDAILKAFASDRITFKQTNDALDSLRATGELTAAQFDKASLAVIKLGTALNDQQAAKDIAQVLAGGPVPASLTPYGNKKEPKPKSTEARDEFGRDAADRIANLVDQFDAAPDVIAKTNAKVRELDDLIDDLNRKKPIGFADLVQQAEAAKVIVREGLIREVAKSFEQPKTLADKAAVAVRQLDAVIADLNANRPAGFEKLIADAETAKGVVRDGLQKPFADFLRDQKDALEVQRLTAEGRLDEAAALQQVQRLQATMGPLTDAQRAAVLAVTQAMRAQGRAIEENRQRNEKYIEAIGGIKTVVEEATQAFVRGDLGQLLKSPGKLLDVFQQFQGRQVFDRIFGGLFQELQDEVNGTTVVRDASDKMARAVEAAAASITQLGNAAAGAAGAVAGAGAPGGANPAPSAGTSAVDAASGDIVVNGRRDPIATALSKVGERIAGTFTKPENAKRIGQQIGTFAGKGLAGAATGSVVAGVSRALGVKLNGTGAQIGGAIGNFLPIPGGSIIGSLAGGLIGNLFGTKKASGTSVITGQGAATSTGTSRATSKAASSLAEAVQNGVANVAAQLGGSLGRYNVSIGTYDGDYRVSTSGQTGELSFGKKNKSKSTLFDFADDQGAAIAFAVQTAVKQGAVDGLSAAVRQALGSSDNLDTALKEALNVRALEQQLGGLGSQLKATFDAESAAARERLRLARSYGLDVIAVEKINAEQRTKLVDDTLKARVGSLSEFLQSVKFGDLFEGTAVERRAALLKEIDKVQADAEAGKDGAADQLVALRSQLINLSRDSFGTADPSFAADRNGSIAAIERVIQLETDRVNAAAGITAATNAALERNNTLTSETNDLIAQNVAATRDLSRQIAASGYSGGSSVDRSITGRTVSLQ